MKIFFLVFKTAKSSSTFFSYVASTHNPDERTSSSPVSCPTNATQSQRTMSDDGNTDSDALEWARESLRRRRSELAREKESMIAAAETTFRPDEEETSRVSSLLQRGQALLAEAEVHSNLLGRYVKKDDEEEKRDNDGQSASDGGGFLSDFLRETQHGEIAPDRRGEDGDADEKPIAPFLPVETPAWNDSENAAADTPTVEGGSAKFRLDQLIAKVRQQDDDDDPRAETPPRRIAEFDPSALKSGQRAQFRRARLDEELAAAEEEMLRLSSFKALPLPDNTPVKNNPLASTKAFECRTASLQKLVGRDHGKSRLNDASSVASTFGSFDCAESSVATACTSLDKSLLLSEYDNDEDRERARQVRAERTTRKQHLLDTVNETIFMEGTEDDATTVCSQGGDYLEDPSTVRQLTRENNLQWTLSSQTHEATATNRQATSQAEANQDSAGGHAERHSRHRPERPVRSSLDRIIEPGCEAHRGSTEGEGVRRLGQLPAPPGCDRRGPSGSRPKRKIDAPETVRPPRVVGET